MDFSFCDFSDVSVGRVVQKLLLKLSRVDGFMTNGLAPIQRYNSADPGEFLAVHIYFGIRASLSTQGMLISIM